MWYVFKFCQFDQILVSILYFTVIISDMWGMYFSSIFILLTYHANIFHKHLVRMRLRFRFPFWFCHYIKMKYDLWLCVYLLHDMYLITISLPRKVDFHMKQKYFVPICLNRLKKDWFMGLFSFHTFNARYVRTIFRCFLLKK